MWLSIYPLVNVYITMERSTIFNGKTHYFDWAIFNSYVKLPEGTTLYPYRPHDFDFAIPLALYHWAFGIGMLTKRILRSQKNVICLDMVSRPCFQSSARLVMGQSLPLLQQALQQQAVPVRGILDFENIISQSWKQQFRTPLKLWFVMKLMST